MKNRAFISALVLLIVTLGCVSHVSAQLANSNQVGIRLGSFSGVTFRHINGNQSGLEADLLMNDGIDWAMLSVLYEKHLSLGQGFVFTFGGGGFFAGNYKHQLGSAEAEAMKPAAGVESILGFEYLIPGVPMGVGVDMRPRFAISTEPYWVWDAGLVFHYIF